MQETLAETFLVELAKKVAERAINDPATLKTTVGMIMSGFLIKDKRDAEQDRRDAEQDRYEDSVIKGLSVYFGYPFRM